MLENRLADEPGSEARTILFRFVQETLANARDHARATRIDVLLESRDDGAVAEVRDNGIGFDVDEALLHGRPGHLGLATMRERAELAAGWLEIESAPGLTRVACWIPESLA